MNASPSSSRRIAPSPRSASESSGRGIDGWCSAVGWNCMNSRSATRRRRAAPSRCRRRSTAAGFVVTAKHWPAPPVASSDVAGADNSWRAPSASSGDDAGAPAALDEQVGGEPALVDVGAGPCDRTADQRPLDLGAGRVAARVHDPGHASGRPRGRARVVRPSHRGRSARRARSARGHASGPSVDEHAHRVGVAQPAARGERVGAVQLGRVVVVEQRRGHAALRVAGRRPAELALGEHRRPTGRLGARRAPRPRARATPLPSTRRSVTGQARRSDGRAGRVGAALQRARGRVHVGGCARRRARRAARSRRARLRRSRA